MAALKQMHVVSSVNEVLTKCKQSVNEVLTKRICCCPNSTVIGSNITFTNQHMYECREGSNYSFQ